MIAALAAAWAAGGIPAITAAAGGAVSLVGGAASIFLARYRVYFILAGLAGLVAASVGVTLWITNLQHTKEAYDALRAENIELSGLMGCKSNEAILACYQRRRSEAAEARIAEIAAQARTAADEANRLAAQRDAAQAALEKSDAEADADQDAAEAIPGWLNRYYDRKRAGMGLQP